ncbi:MAG: PEP-CTERM sorting domain-containing protein [Planctomycetaceae bacterium]
MTPPPAVPEPTTASLVALALAGRAGWRRRARRIPSPSERRSNVDGASAGAGAATATTTPPPLLAADRDVCG